jgi:hypothetical protein
VFKSIFTGVLVGVLGAGCGDLGLGNSSGTGVSGSILGSDFSSIAGSAESFGGTYTLTLADTEAFSCNSFDSPPPTYLTVVLADVSAPTSISAQSAVSFNSYEDGVNDVEAATSGMIDIDEIDDISGVISGTIDASGPTSFVSGSFSAEICP